MRSRKCCVIKIHLESGVGTNELLIDLGTKLDPKLNLAVRRIVKETV
jgi:hypothetical protein